MNLDLLTHQTPESLNRKYNLFSAMHHIVYCTTHLPSGRYYIGMHSSESLDDGYFGSGKAIKALLKKHPVEEFSRSVVADFDTRAEAVNLESMIVQEFLLNKDHFPLVLNLCVGGSNPYDKKEMSEKARANISAAVKRRYEDPAVREHQSKVAKEACARPEVKANRIAAAKAKWSSDEGRASRRETAARVTSTDEYKATMSARTADNWNDPEIRARRCAALKAAYTPEVAAKRSAGIKAANERRRAAGLPVGAATRKKST